MRNGWRIAVLTACLAMAQGALAQGLHEVHAGKGLPCTACHLADNPPPLAPANSVCTTCHGTMTAPLAAGEEVRMPDPHRSPHLGPQEVPDCIACHSVHAVSEPLCVTCHRSFDFDMNSFGDAAK